MIKNMIKFRKHQEENIERISELFQAEILLFICFCLCVLSFCFVGVILCLICGGELYGESDSGKKVGNYSFDCDDSYIKSQTVQVRSPFFAALL